MESVLFCTDFEFWNFFFEQAYERERFVENIRQHDTEARKLLRVLLLFFLLGSNLGNKIAA